MPTFGVILLGIFWRRATPAGGLAGLVTGTVGALLLFVLELAGVLEFATPMEANLWRSWWAWVITTVVTVVVSLRTAPQSDEELEGLVWSRATGREHPRERAFHRRPEVLAGIALVIVVVLNVICW